MKLIDAGSQVDAIFLDFQKAFDSVPHNRLLAKLRAYGISDQLCEWIKDFLTGRTQYVVVEGESSSSLDVTSGVPQGSVIGPLLFLIFRSDLGDKVKSLFRLFAFF